MIPLKTEIATPVWFYILALSFILLLMISVIWLFWVVIKKWLSDKVIIIDKNNRWKLLDAKLRGLTTYSYDKKIYHLSDKIALLNCRGKVLYIFTENKPEPLLITHGNVEWLDSKSLQTIMDNKIVQDLVKPQDSFKDFMLILGAGAAILAMIASGIVLAISLGLIKIKP